jgi:HEAT repeat protein
MADASRDNIDQLVADLGSKDATKRLDARATLIEMGSPAVPALLDSLDASHQHLRWEVARTLAEIADPVAADRLVEALGDEDTDVRWVVGAALISLDRHAVKPLLHKLTQSDLPDGVYPGAHHVFHDLAHHDDLAPLLRPVLKALDQLEPEIAVPQVAAQALREFAE